MQEMWDEQMRYIAMISWRKHIIHLSVALLTRIFLPVFPTYPHLTRRVRTCAVLYV